MHSTSRGPSFSKRCSGLPCMPWPLWSLWRRLQQLQLHVVLVAVLLNVWEQWWRSDKRRRVWQQWKAEMVASRFVRRVHAC